MRHRGRKLGFIEQRRREKQTVAALQAGLGAMERGEIEEPDPDSLRKPPFVANREIQFSMPGELGARADALAARHGWTREAVLIRAYQLGMRQGDTSG